MRTKPTKSIPVDGMNWTQTTAKPVLPPPPDSWILPDSCQPPLARPTFYLIHVLASNARMMLRIIGFMYLVEPNIICLTISLFAFSDGWNGSKMHTSLYWNTSWRIVCTHQYHYRVLDHNKLLLMSQILHIIQQHKFNVIP